MSASVSHGLSPFRLAFNVESYQTDHPIQGLKKELLTSITAWLSPKELFALKKTARYFYKMSPHLFASHPRAINQIFRRFFVSDPEAVGAFLNTMPESCYSNIPLQLTDGELTYRDTYSSCAAVRRKFPNVKRLTYTDRTPFHLEKVLALCPSVRELDGIPLSVVKPDLLAKISALCPNLVSLALKCSGWSNAPRQCVAVSTFPAMPRLERLKLLDGWFQLQDLSRWLTQQTYLLTLKLDVAADAQADLTLPSSIQSLTLANNAVYFLPAIGTLTSLRQLSIELPTTGTYDLNTLEVPHSVRKFKISRYSEEHVSVPGVLTKLQGCTALFALNFFRCFSKEEEDFSTIQPFPSVKELNLIFAETKLGFYLQLFPALQKLQISIDSGVFEGNQEITTIHLPASIEDLTVEINTGEEMLKTVPAIARQLPNLKKLTIYMRLESLPDETVDPAKVAENMQPLILEFPTLTWSLHTKQEMYKDRDIQYMDSEKPYF